MKGEFGETPNPLRQNPPMDTNNNPEPETVLGEENLITETFDGTEAKPAQTIEVQEMGVIENLDGTPASMTAETVTTTEVAPMANAETTNPEMANAEAANSGTINTAVANPAMENATANPAIVGSAGNIAANGQTPAGQMIDPTARPMEQAAPANEEPKKKMKKGYFVAIIICLLVAVACGVAALLLFLNKNSGDPVAKAVEKLISGETAENVALDGTLTLSPTETGTGLEDIRLDISGAATASGKIHNFDLTAYINLEDGSSLSVDVSEIYTANEDLYLKIDGLADIIGTIALLSEDEQLEMVATAVESIDGEWIKISEDVLDEVTNTIGSNSTMTCLTDLYTGIESNQNSIQKLYSENSFIVSDTEAKNLIASKTNPVYLVTIDTEKFTNFVDGAQSLSAYTDYLDCIGADDTDLSADSILSELDEAGEIYVEIDNDYNFTRLYTKPEAMLQDEDYDAELDLSFSYPTTINISEPDEYIDLETVLTQLLYGNTEIEVETESES